MLNSNKDGEFQKFILNFLIAGVTSSFAKSIVAPIDRMKLILQNQSSALQILNGQRKEYKGLFDCLIRLPKEQGYLSFWRGNGANLLRYIPSQALNFSFNDLFKSYFSKLFGGTNFSSSPFVAYLSGGCAGACVTFTLYPLKFCQTRLSVDMGSVSKIINRHTSEIEREFHGIADCFKKISNTEGISGLYRGFTLAIVTAMTYRALYFGLFDNLKQLYAYQSLNNQDKQTKPSLVMQFVFAQFVTTIAGLVTYPSDTVGRRLMLDSGRKSELKVFKGTWNAFRLIYTKEGFYGFYKGAFTNCLRGVCGALVLVLYDEVLHHMKWKDKLSSSNT